MKFAFLILAHEDPKHLRRLIHALDDPHFDVYVHIAANGDLAAYGFDAYQLRHSRLTVLDEQIRTYWGDISLVDAMLALYHRAFENGPYDRYITLSGLDYPLKSNGRSWKPWQIPAGNSSLPGPCWMTWISRSGASISGSTISWPGSPGIWCAITALSCIPTGSGCEKGTKRRCRCIFPPSGMPCPGRALRTC